MSQFCDFMRGSKTLLIWKSGYENARGQTREGAKRDGRNQTWRDWSETLAQVAPARGALYKVSPPTKICIWLWESALPPFPPSYRLYRGFYKIDF